MKSLLLLLALLIVQSAYAAADIYKCVGKNGRTHYQSAACAEGAVIPIDAAQAPPAPVRQPSFTVDHSYGGVRHIVRSEAQKNLFKFTNPCPSTSEASGPCPGYVIDHIKPLACGGADDPRNMQWQTVAAAKAKDGWERDGCQPKRAFYNISPSASPRVHVGPRGGRYVLDAGGRKHYLGRSGN